MAANGANKFLKSHHCMILGSTWTIAYLQCSYFILIKLDIGAIFLQITLDNIQLIA
jgi:hypothetical protein